MTTVYEVIEEICRTKNLSLRQLALRAGIAPSTLASIMERRVEKIYAHTLDRIARTFGMTWKTFWFDKDEGEFHDETKRVSASLSVRDKERILEIVKARECETVTPPFTTMGSYVREGAMRNTGQILSQQEISFRDSIFLVLGKLNLEGLMEAMRQILEIANDPKYCKERKKEDT